MQITGGGAGRVRPSRYTAQLAGSYDQKPDPQDVARAAMHLHPEDIARSSSLGDVAKQVYLFPGALYNDADQQVRGLINLASSLIHGADPGDLAYDATQAQLDAWSHPVTYANEHPLGFAMDLAAGAGLAGGALSSAAERAGVSVPEFLGSDAGAIGPLGRRLDAGDIPDINRPTGELARPGHYSAEMPAIHELIYTKAPDRAEFSPPYLEHGKAVFKSDIPEVRSGWMAGPRAEDAYAELNRLTGGRVNQPGVQYGDFEHVPMRYVSSKAEGGYKGHVVRFPRETGPGSLIEWVDNLRGIEDPSELDWTNPETVQAARAQDILDQITGNQDRAYGANYYAAPNEMDNMTPVAIDQGAAFPRSLAADTMYNAPAWAEDFGSGAGHMFTPEELDWVRQLLGVLEDPTESLVRLRDPGDLGTGPRLRGAIDRARKLLEDRRMTPNYASEYGW